MNSFSLPGWRSKKTRDEVLPVKIDASDIAHSASAKNPALLAVDQALIWVLLAVALFGLVMVYSASISMPDNPRFARYAATHFAWRHLASMVMGFVLALLVFQVPVRQWESSAPWLFVFSLVTLVVVLIPHVGIKVNGAQRWISLSFMSFQPSELVKFCILIYAAGYMVRKMDVKESFFHAVLPMAAAVAVVGLLLLAEPDMGAFLVVAVIAMGILFLGGVNARMFFLIATVMVVAFASIVALSPWRRERIFAYLDPFSEEHALGKGYQLSHALIAIGRGEVFGVGLGGSVEKLHWLPEAHTDFLLAVVGEEFGLIGLTMVIVAFFWITRRIVHIGRQAIALDQVFAGLMAQGIAIWVGFQAFVNIGVNLGALPTKGLTLPLMSYGGSAMVMNAVALAVVLRIDAENRRLMRMGGV